MKLDELRDMLLTGQIPCKKGCPNDVCHCTGKCNDWIDEIPKHKQFFLTDEEIKNQSYNKN